MFEAAWKRVKGALFPVAVTIKKSETEIEIRFRGSGFFLDTKGTFLTCAHVIEPTPAPGETYMYVGRLPEWHVPHRPLITLYRDDANDILVGRAVNVSIPGILDISDREVEAGACVAICGYPTFVDEKGRAAGFGATFQPTFVLERFNAKTGVGVRGSVLMRDNPHFGMSGGPVVGINGSVIGMQSSVTRPRFSQGHGRQFKVENGIAVGVDALNKALTIARNANAAQSDTA